jgi:hypothetical protein
MVAESRTLGVLGGKGWFDEIVVYKTLRIDGSMVFGDAHTDSLTVEGTATFKADSLVSTNKKIQFRDSGIYLSSGADGKLTISADGTGEDDITLDGTVTVADKVTMALSSDSTSGSIAVESMYVKQTMTGAGGVGGRARFHLDSNVALGGWSNALKAQVTYGTEGMTTGLGSAFCAEMDLSEGTTTGTYALFEGELNLGASASTGTATSIFYISVNGSGAGTFDSNGHLFNIQGVTASSGKFLQPNTASQATHAIRILIGTTPYYIMLTDTEA